MLLLLSSTADNASAASAGHRSQYSRMASSSGLADGSQAGSGPGKNAAAARAAELEPYVQDACAEMAAAVAAHLRQQLERLGEPQGGASGAPRAEQVGSQTLTL